MSIFNQVTHKQMLIHNNENVLNVLSASVHEFS